MSAGPIVDSVQQGAPPAGLGKPTPDFMGRQSNTGAGQFVNSGPLNPSDFLQGLMTQGQPSGQPPGRSPNYQPHVRPPVRPLWVVACWVVRLAVHHSRIYAT